MHYYPHNIADFNNATRHLTRVERSVYRDAIERYYDTEEPLPGNDFDRLSRVLLCQSEEEKAALSIVMDEFFTLDGGVYRHERCDAEIEKYRANTSAKARAGKASAAARRRVKGAKDNASKEQKATRVEHALNGCATDEQLTNNQEPVTNNHKPKDKGVGKPPPFRADRMVLPSTVNTDSWAEWCAYRSSKKKPITEKAAEKQIELLTQHPESVQRQIIETSIANDYQGLFPPKGGGKLSVVSGSTRTASIHDELTDTSWAR